MASCMLLHGGPSSPFLFLAYLPHRRESLVSGRRVKGREAIACDAVGALEALAATGTLTRRGRRHTSSAVMLPVSLSDHRISVGARRTVPGRPSGPRGGASAAGRGGAQRSRLDPMWLNSAVQRLDTAR